MWCNLPWLRSIYLREKINHVHGHQACSSLSHEGILHARSMGIPCTFTDHSLFGFADISSILTNKLLKVTLSDVDNVICVSHTSRENTVLRAALDPSIVHVIPNAVIAGQFTPDPGQRDQDFGKPQSLLCVFFSDHIAVVTIVVLSRLMYRKGVDLLVAVIPRICKAHPRVRFIIAGDGEKRVDLEQMRDEYMLHERVTMVGAVPSSEARNVLVKGDIFLNTSLTEAFCIAIVEAASCGLLVVSTAVGGVPEVLPDHMVLLSPPNDDHLFEKVMEAVSKIESNSVDTTKFNAEISKMYSWENIALRTEAVYLRSIKNSRPADLYHRLTQCHKSGVVLGKLVWGVIVVDFLILLLLELLIPSSTIDAAPDFRLERDLYEEFIKKKKDKKE